MIDFVHLISGTGVIRFCIGHYILLLQQKSFCRLHLINLLHGTKNFPLHQNLVTWFHYISRMQRTNYLLHDSHPDQEGTKGPLTILPNAFQFLFVRTIISSILQFYVNMEHMRDPIDSILCQNALFLFVKNIQFLRQMFEIFAPFLLRRIER